MRKITILILLFLATLTGLDAQPPKSGEQENVKQAITKFFDGIAALDTKMMEHYITKDFLLLEDGAIWNMDSLEIKLNPLRSIGFNRTNYLNFIRVEIKGNTAWVAYNNAADMNVNGQKRNIKWMESAVLIKEGKNWKVQLLHSTPLKQKSN